MPVLEVKYVVARNEWCAKRTLNMVLQGKAPESCLFPNQKKAANHIKTMRAVKQEEFSVFRLRFKR